MHCGIQWHFDLGSFSQLPAWREPIASELRRIGQFLNLVLAKNTVFKIMHNTASCFPHSVRWPATRFLGFREPVMACIVTDLTEIWRRAVL